MKVQAEKTYTLTENQLFNCMALRHDLTFNIENKPHETNLEHLMKQCNVHGLNYDLTTLEIKDVYAIFLEINEYDNIILTR